MATSNRPLQTRPGHVGKRSRAVLKRGTPPYLATATWQSRALPGRPATNKRETRQVKAKANVRLILGGSGQQAPSAAQCAHLRCSWRPLLFLPAALLLVVLDGDCPAGQGHELAHTPHRPSRRLRRVCLQEVRTMSMLHFSNGLPRLVSGQADLKLLGFQDAPGKHGCSWRAPCHPASPMAGAAPRGRRAGLCEPSTLSPSTRRPGECGHVNSRLRRVQTISPWIVNHGAPILGKRGIFVASVRVRAVKAFSAFSGESGHTFALPLLPCNHRTS